MLDELSKKIEVLQDILIAHSTGGQAEDSQYQPLRKEIIATSLIKDIVPPFLRTCRSLDEFWSFIKNEYGRYAERRKFIRDAFRPMLDRLERTNAAPSDHSVTVALQNFDAETIHQIWLRAMDRRETGPRGSDYLSANAAGDCM